MDTADDVDFEPDGLEGGTAERTERGTLEDVFGKRKAALTLRRSSLLQDQTPGAVHRCGLLAPRRCENWSPATYQQRVLRSRWFARLILLRRRMVSGRRGRGDYGRAYFTFYPQVFLAMGFAAVIEDKVADVFWLDEPAAASSMPSPSLSEEDLSEWAFRSLATRSGYLRGHERATVLYALHLFVGPGFKGRGARFETHTSTDALIVCGAWSTIQRGRSTNAWPLAFVRGNLSMFVQGCVNYERQRSCQRVRFWRCTQEHAQEVQR